MHTFPISPSLLYSNEACKVRAFIIFNLQILKLRLKSSEFSKVTLTVKQPRFSPQPPRLVSQAGALGTHSLHPPAVLSAQCGGSLDVISSFHIPEKSHRQSFHCSQMYEGCKETVSVSEILY